MLECFKFFTIFSKKQTNGNLCSVHITVRFYHNTNLYYYINIIIVYCRSTISNMLNCQSEFSSSPFLFFFDFDVTLLSRYVNKIITPITINIPTIPKRTTGKEVFQLSAYIAILKICKIKFIIVIHSLSATLVNQKFSIRLIVA